MTSRRIGMVLGVVGAVLPVSLALLGGCSQPPIDCRAGRGDFAVVFQQVSGDAGCGALTTGFVGLESYYYKLEGEDKQDYGRSKLAIQSEVLGYLLWETYQTPYEDLAHKPYGLGDFTTTEPDENGVCYVPNFSSSEVSIPVIPGEPPDPDTPARDVRFDFRNAKVKVTTDIPGTQFTADFTYAEDIDGVSCTAEYRVIGVWPSYADCTGSDANGDPIPDDSLCHLDPATAPPGSVVMNPAFDLRCDPDLFVCIPVSNLPELN